MRRRPAQEDDHTPPGDTPPAATGTMLHGDPMTQLAMHSPAAAPTPMVGSGPAPVPPGGEVAVPVILRHSSNELWTPRILAIPTGLAVEVVGRDDDRETFDITNQSFAVTGTSCLLWLFADEQQARNFADDSATIRTDRLAHGLKAIALPDGAGRTFTHTASMWAVPSGADGIAVIDVSTERKSRYRR